MPDTTEKKQFKAIELRELTAVGEGAGGFSGYPSKFYELDSYGDIAMPGAYRDTIPDFLRDGFVSHSHEWEANETIGYPTEAREDNVGLYSEMAFHSTEDAQQIRIKAAERLAAGKTVKLSIGYITEDMEIIQPTSYQSELPKYIPAPFLAKVLEQAGQFPCIRLLKKIRLFEYSIVTSPALHSADVLGVKSVDRAADDLSFSEHLEATADAVEGLARRAKAKSEMRTKEGRTLSTATVTKMKTIHGHLTEGLAHLGEMLTEADPPKQIDMAERKRVLNQEILRFESRRTTAQ